jgi:hypothetical protein
MATFRIVCRTHEIAPQHYEARVFVVPTSEEGAELAARSECRIFESCELANSECVRMADAMKARLERWGHQVVAVDAAGTRDEAGAR